MTPSDQFLYSSSSDNLHRSTWILGYCWKSSNTHEASEDTSACEEDKVILDMILFTQNDVGALPIMLQLFTA